MGEELTRAKEIDDAVKMADAKKRADAEEAAAAGSKLDQILDCLASLGSRMDAYDGERKAKDEDGESDMESEIEKDKPRELAADSKMVRKDSAAADVEEIENFKREIGATHKVEADSVLAHIQSHAERASSAWGKDAHHPWDGESIPPIAGAPRVSISNIPPNGRASIFTRYPGKR